MIDKDKIKEINSKRKPSKGFNESIIKDASRKARSTIERNRALANSNIKDIYSTCFHLSSTLTFNCTTNKISERPHSSSTFNHKKVIDFIG